MPKRNRGRKADAPALGPVRIEKIKWQKRFVEAFRQGRPLAELAIGIIVTIAAAVPLALFVTSIGWSLLLAAGATLVAFLTARLLRSISFIPIFRLIFSLNRHLTTGNRRFFQGMTREQVGSVVTEMSQLVGGVYVPDDLRDIQRYAKYCFESMEQANPVYLGVDSNLPSRYMKDYSWFLELHEDKLDRLSPREQDSGLRNGVDDKRVIVAWMGELTKEFNDNQEEYVDFIQWHRRNHVTLLHIEPDKAKAQAPRRLPVDSTTLDVAYWGSLVGGFKIGDTATGVKFWFLDASDYSLYATYVNNVLLAADPFPESPTGLRMVSHELAVDWANYIDLDKRARTFGRFSQRLLADIREDGVILDAAAGIGAETLNLLHAGFTVIPNEVDGELKKQLEHNAELAKRNVAVLTHPWEHLAERIENHLRFTAILVVGNSLTMVTGSQSERGDRLRKRCLANFLKVMRRDSRLIVDERNFQFMLDNRLDIIENPYEVFPPAQHGDVMYGGSDLRGFPAEIDENRVIWRFYRRPNDVSNSDELRKNVVEEEPGIVLHPFKAGELYTLLTESGFEVEKTFGDLEEMDWDGQAPYPKKADGTDFQFFTYVARPKTAT